MPQRKAEAQRAGARRTVRASVTDTFFDFPIARSFRHGSQILGRWSRESTGWNHVAEATGFALRTQPYCGDTGQQYLAGGHDGLHNGLSVRTNSAAASATMLASQR